MSDSKEFSAVLHVAGRTFDPAPILAAYPRVKPYAVWHRGDPFLKNRKHTDGGFSVDVASTADGTSIARRCVEVLRRLAPALRAARRSGAPPVLDIGVMADRGAWAVVRTTFSPDHLGALAKLGVELRVSSYLDVAQDGARTRPAGARRRQ